MVKKSVSAEPQAPQLEKGFVRLACGSAENDIIRALLKAKLTGAEWDVVMIIIRKTWGFLKQSDKISLSQFGAEGKRHRSNYINALKSLINRRIVLVVKSGLVPNSPLAINEYRFNKAFNDWTSTRIGTSTKNSKKLVPDSRHTKENHYKKKPIARTRAQEKIKLTNFLKQFMRPLSASKEAEQYLNRYGEEVVRKSLNSSTCISTYKFVECCEFYKKNLKKAKNETG